MTDPEEIEKVTKKHVDKLDSFVSLLISELIDYDLKHDKAEEEAKTDESQAQNFLCLERFLAIHEKTTGVKLGKEL